MKKRVLAILLTLVMVFTLLPISALAGEENGDASSDGLRDTAQNNATPLPDPDKDWYQAEAKELVIADKSDFLAFQQKVNGGTTFEGKKIILDANLDFEGATLEQIGGRYMNKNKDVTHPFKGTFDGNGKSISNFRIENTGNKYGDFTGLFGHINGATIRDLRIVKGTCISRPNYDSTDGAMHQTVAALAGNATDSRIENCIIEGCIIQLAERGQEPGQEEVKYGVSAAAGLVGRASGGNNAAIENCKVMNTTVSGDACVGGAIGVRFDSFPITNYTASSVSLTSAVSAGAFIGASPSGVGKVSNCIATGMVITGAQIGGLAGSANKFAADNCYVQAKLITPETDGEAIAAGFIGNDGGSDDGTPPTLKSVYTDIDFSECSGENRYAVAYMTANPSQTSTPPSKTYTMSQYTNCGYVVHDNTPENQFRLPPKIEGLTAPTVPKVAAKQEPLQLTMGETSDKLTTWTGQGFTVKSDNAEILSVDGNGTLTAIHAGTTAVKVLKNLNGSTFQLLSVPVDVAPGSGGDPDPGGTSPVIPVIPFIPSTTTVTVTNPDGSITTTVIDRTTGTVTTTTVYPNGVKTVTTDEPGRNVTASVMIPYGVGTATVSIPADTTPGTVAVDAKTGEIVKLSVPTGNGMIVKLNGSAELVLVDNSKYFTDTYNHWAGDAIDFAVAHGMFSGTAENTFSPDSPMTRAMLMTVLARFDGVDTSGGAAWYEEGMEWAKASGVSDGTNPDGDITREQLAAMLYRYAGSPAVDGSIDHFTDAGKVSGYADQAMRWTVSTGIISGMGDGTLAPQANATRAQVAAMLMRFCANLTK